ncbi:hypothetical protein BDV29DRAFT_100455 [Aspergillus leporis]|uniref:Myb-like domain-containing protein n=1 Tax=Aspergillus leporis TaxID=41062 RepID=A0A5N5XES5_9EURO|nr:hypothetical protein BDV29DRAFT_100455 [Aspergillus leporis]
MQTKRQRLSRGGRWTEEERRSLLRLRNSHRHLNWDQFQRLYFPKRSYMALTKAYSDMRLKGQTKENTMVNNPSNGITSPSKTNRSNKRPSANEGSVDERTRKQSKTTDKDPIYIPGDDDERTEDSDYDLETSQVRGDIQYDGFCQVTSANNRARGAGRQATASQPRGMVRLTIPQRSKDGSNSETSLLGKTASQSPRRGVLPAQNKDPGTARGPVHNSRPSLTTMPVQSPAQPKLHHSNPPPKTSQLSQSETHAQSRVLSTKPEILSNIIKSFDHQKRLYDSAPQIPETQAEETQILSVMTIAANAYLYRSMRLLAETQMGEIKELKSQLLTLKKELETQCQMKDEKNKLLEAELGEARSEAAKISQQQAKSGQAQRCAGCPKLQERITSLEMEAQFFEGLKKQLDSYMKAKEHPPGSSTITTVSG